jgi:hypothetical protein
VNGTQVNGNFETKVAGSANKPTYLNFLAIAYQEHLEVALCTVLIRDLYLLGQESCPVGA